LFALPTPEQLIAVRDGSASLPTPRTSDTNGPGKHGDGGMDLRTTVNRLLPTPMGRDYKDTGENTAYAEHAETHPQPTLPRIMMVLREESEEE
jgi:hypothetical protein